MRTPTLTTPRVAEHAATATRATTIHATPERQCGWCDVMLSGPYSGVRRAHDDAHTHTICPACRVRVRALASTQGVL